MTLPTDPIQLNDEANADRSRAGTLAGLGQQRTQTALEFGYTPTYDEHGFVKALAMDPNNPYAKSALLLKSYQENLRKNTQSFASRGQQYSGAYGVAQSLSDQGYSQGSNTLQNAFINFIARNQGSINSANSNYTTALTNAQSGALQRAANADTGAAPAPTESAASHDGTPSAAMGSRYPFNSTGFAGLDPTKKYRQASNGKLQVQNSNGSWRYV